MEEGKSKNKAYEKIGICYDERESNKSEGKRGRKKTGEE